MLDHPKALLPSYNVPGIMSPRDNNVLLLIWLENVNCLLWWTIVTALFSFLINLLFIFQKKHWGAEGDVQPLRMWWTSWRLTQILIMMKSVQLACSVLWFLFDWQIKMLCNTELVISFVWKDLHAFWKDLDGFWSLFGPIHHICHICHAGTLYKNRFLSISILSKFILSL